MEIIVATVSDDYKADPDHPINSWLATAKEPIKLTVIKSEGHGPVEAYQRGLQQSTEDILCFFHDDVTIYEEGWDVRVKEQFKNPMTGVVGFGGGTVHGRPGLYRSPYLLTDLARDGYMSNVTDAEIHGRRWAGNSVVAVLDGFSLIVSRELLIRAGGWPVKDLIFHCYDYWLCCICHRYGKSVKFVGIDCYHAGGQTSTMNKYNDWLRDELGIDDVKVHQDSHRFIYENFCDVLPWDVNVRGF